MIIVVLMVIAKFSIGLYQFQSPSRTEIFIKPFPVWKSIFYSPLNKENKTYQELTEDEEYEQKMFDIYAYKHLLSTLKLVSCGDIFSRFANKPNDLEYIGCDSLDDQQTLVVAKYRVIGKNAETIENYLIENHQMPPMKIFKHTGYEPNGYGKIENTLNRISPYMDIYIDMNGYARRGGEYDKYGQKKMDFSLLPKEEVPYFYVNVRIMEI